MYSREQYLGTRRLGIFADLYSENTFILKNSKEVFARINKIGNKWIVWFYKKHLQKEFCKLRDALSYANTEFIEMIEKG